MSAQIRNPGPAHAAPPGGDDRDNGSAERAIGDGFALAQAVLADPALLARIPDSAVVVSLPPDTLQGTRARFTIDLGDDRWGTAPRAELGGRTAGEMRAALSDAVQQAGERAPVAYALGTIIVLDATHVAVEEEIAPGLYRCTAIEPASLAD